MSPPKLQIHSLRHKPDGVDLSPPFMTMAVQVAFCSFGNGPNCLVEALPASSPLRANPGRSGNGCKKKNKQVLVFYFAAQRLLWSRRHRHRAYHGSLWFCPCVTDKVGDVALLLYHLPRLASCVVYNACALTTAGGLVCHVEGGGK